MVHAQNIWHGFGATLLRGMRAENLAEIWGISSVRYSRRHKGIDFGLCLHIIPAYMHSFWDIYLHRIRTTNTHIGFGLLFFTVFAQKIGIDLGLLCCAVFTQNNGIRGASVLRGIRAERMS